MVAACFVWDSLAACYATLLPIIVEMMVYGVVQRRAESQIA
jgi:heme exporter protein D